MSRAMRRHPMVQKSAKPAPIRVAPKAKKPGKDAPQQSGKSLVSRLLRPRWVEDIISELRKVTWPTTEETRNLTFVVIAVSAVAGLFLGGVDGIFSWLVDHLLKL